MIEGVAVPFPREARSPGIDSVGVPDNAVLGARILQCESGEDGDGSGSGIVLLNDPCRMQGSLRFAVQPSGIMVFLGGG